MMYSDSFYPSESYLRNCTILEELDNHDPTDEEVRMYANDIGIDPDTEPDLLYIAREGVSAPVPRGWTVLQNRQGAFFYQQTCSGICIWDHPLDAQFRLRVVEARSKKSNAQFAEKYAAPLQNGIELTPVKTETVYHPLPIPRSSLNTSKVSSVPQRAVSVSITNLPSQSRDSSSSNTSIPNNSMSNLGLPRLSPSPTRGSPRRRVLSEINHLNTAPVLNKSSCTSRQNFDPFASANVMVNLTDQFIGSMRVTDSIPSQLPQHQQGSSNASRHIFVDPDGDVASRLFSPPESPLLRRSHRLGSQDRYCSQEILLRPKLLTSPVEQMAELKEDVGMQNLLKEQKRLHEKMAILKVTYKTYKRQLECVESNIRALQSTAAFSAPVDATRSDGIRATRGAESSTATVNPAPQKPPPPSSSYESIAVSETQQRHHRGDSKRRTQSIRSAGTSRNPRSNL